MIEVELPDGSIAEFPEGTPDSVIEGVLAQEYARNINRVIATTPDGGRVMEGPNGRSFTSPGYSTSDPAIIDRIMEGASPAQLSASGFDQSTIAEAPMVAGAAKVVQGVPFVGEYADEAIGAVFGDKAKSGVRALQSAMDRERPGTSMGLQVTGGILGSIPMALAAGPSIIANAPTSMAGKVFTGLLGGAATGGSEGFVSGYGAGNAGDRMQSAMDRGILGTVIGGAMGGLAPLVAKGGKAVADYAVDLVNKRSRTLPGLSREATEQMMLRANADDIASTGAANIRAAGPDAMVADAGPATAQFLDQATNMSMSGAKIGREATETRAASAAGRLTTAFDATMGGPQGIGQLSTAIKDAASPGIKAAYADAYSTPIDYASGQGRRIEALLKRIPAGKAQEAFRRATERMTFDGAPSPQIMASIAPDGTVTFQQMPNVMQLDYVKRAFDAIARDGTDPITGRLTDDAAFAKRIAGELRSALKDAIPSYGDALARASDEFALQDATQLGARLLDKGTTRETVANWATTATPVEKRALVAGLRSEIDETMANVKRAVTDGNMEAREAAAILKPLSSRAMKEKLASVMPSGDVDTLMTAIDQATASIELRGAVARNSATAPRLVGDALLRTSREYAPSEMARETVSGGILAGPRRVLQVVAGNTPADKAARDEALYAELAQYLTGPRGAQAEQAAQDMAGLLNYLPRANAVSGAVGRNLGAGTGLLGHLSGVQYLRERGSTGR